MVFPKKERKICTLICLIGSAECFICGYNIVAKIRSVFVAGSSYGVCVQWKGIIRKVVLSL